MNCHKPQVFVFWFSVLLLGLLLLEKAFLEKYSAVTSVLAHGSIPFLFGVLAYSCILLFVQFDLFLLDYFQVISPWVCSFFVILSLPQSACLLSFSAVVFIVYWWFTGSPPFLCAAPGLLLDLFSLTISSSRLHGVLEHESVFVSYLNSFILTSLLPLWLDDSCSSKETTFLPPAVYYVSHQSKQQIYHSILSCYPLWPDALNPFIHDVKDVQDGLCKSHKMKFGNRNFQPDRNLWRKTICRRKILKVRCNIFSLYSETNVVFSLIYLKKKKKSDFNR